MWVRADRDWSIIHVTCPQLVVDYNAHMGGIDLGDQSTLITSLGSYMVDKMC